MRNLGISILGLSFCLLLLSGCGGGVGEAKVKEVGNQKVTLMKEKLAVAEKDGLSDKDRKDQLAALDKKITETMEKKGWSEGDETIFSKNFKAQIDELESKITKKLNPPKS